MKLKVLFISANPSKNLNLDEEIRSVQKAINEHTQKKESIQFIHRPAVRMSDLILLLREKKPHILHFAGHGDDGNGELCMIDDETKEDIPIPTKALTLLFKSIKINGNLRLVFLNSCYSKEQAEVIIKHTDYVIGMNSEINDDTARTLSKQFYASFATGATVEEAFDDAKIMVITNHYGEEEIMELLKRDKSVKDFSIVDIVGKEEQLDNEESNIKQTHSGSGDNVVGDKIVHNKTIFTENNFENIDNKDIMNFD